MSFFDRYARHLSLKEVGYGGVLKLKKSKILIIGAGALGSPALYYLGACGVGTLGISDGDQVELSNLQRQIIHFEKDIHQPKTLSAKEKILWINSQTKVTIHDKIQENNVEKILKDYDFIIEATDDIKTKFLVNDTSIKLNKSLSIAGILQFQGQLLTINPSKKTACYRCLFEKLPKKQPVSCQEAGVLGVIPGVIGTLQATEAIKCLLEIGQPLYSRLLMWDALSMRFKEIIISKRCSLCSD